MIVAAQVLMQELRKAKEGHADALSVARKMRGEARGAESLLAKKDALLASQADQMEGALRRNMLLSETNDQLQAAARRNEVSSREARGGRHRRSALSGRRRVSPPIGGDAATAS